MARTMRITSGADWAKKTQDGAAGAMGNYRDGINRVQESPTAAAADNVDGYINGIQEAVATGRFQQSLRNVSLQDWKNATITKGTARYSQGMQAAGQKLQRGGDILVRALQQAKAATDGMPRNTREERIAKSAAFQRAMAEAADQARGLA